MRTVALGEIVSDARAGFASGEDTEDGIVQIRMNNVTTEGSFDWSKLRRVPVPKKLDELIVKSNDILFNATNSPDLVGKNAVFRGFSEPVTFSNHFIRIRLDGRVADSSLVSRWLTDQWRSGKFKSMCRQWVNQASLKKEQLLSLDVPLPPIDKQRQLAAILDEADDLRRKRREGIQRLHELCLSTFEDRFGGLLFDDKHSRRLGDLADLELGKMLDRKKFNGRNLRPYLRNANVQWFKFDISNLNEMEFDEDELTRFRILPGDILICEGGGAWAVRYLVGP